jgi:hypothetical protein
VHRLFVTTLAAADTLVGIVGAATAAVGSVAAGADLALWGFPLIQLVGLLAGSLADWLVRAATYADLPPERRRPGRDELRLRLHWSAVSLAFGALWAHYAVDYVVNHYPAHAASSGVISFACVFLSMGVIEFMRLLRRMAAGQAFASAIEGLVIGWLRRKSNTPPASRTPPSGPNGEG